MFSRTEIAFIQDCFRRGQREVVLSGGRAAWHDQCEVRIGYLIGCNKEPFAASIARPEHAASKVPALVDAVRDRRVGDPCAIV